LSGLDRADQLDPKSQQVFTTNWRWVTLGLLFLIACGLRLWGIRFGLPYIYHYDEHFYINTALKLGKGIINNPPHAPTGFSNILAVEYGIYFVVGKLFHVFNSVQEYESLFHSDPTNFYLIGRGTSAILGAIIILVVNGLSKLRSSPVTGLIAAGFLTISFLHVRDSHYSVPDVALSLFILFSVALAAKGLHFNRRRYIYLASIVGGFAVAVKWTGLPIALVVLWAGVWCNDGTEQKLINRLFNITIIKIMILFGLGFALGSPQILLNPFPYIDEAFGQLGAGGAGGFEIWQVDTLSGWLFYIKTLNYGVGSVLLLLGTIGVLRRLNRIVKTGDRLDILLLLFPLIYYFLMGSSRHYFARYTIPLIPFVVLFASETVVWFLSWVDNRRAKFGWGLAVGLVILATTQPFLQSIRHNILLTRQDTRTLAKQWIETNISDGAKIAVDWPTFSPPLSSLEEPMPQSDRLFKVEIMEITGLSDHPIKWYRDQGFDYLIASSFIYNITLVNEKDDVERRAFYASLDREFELIKEFQPRNDETEIPFIFDEIYGPAINLWQRERPGPVIKIYAVNDSIP